MPNIVITSTMYDSLTNKELIQKQQDLEIKISKARVMSSLPHGMMEDMMKLAELIDNVIAKRLEDGTMDEDELEEDF